MALWPSVRLCKYVDDISVQKVGRAVGVLQEVPDAVAFLVARLEEDGVPVSRGKAGRPGGKSVVLAS
eukprot:11194734-Lingulodinium_polyedra.AAC.1